MNDTTLPEHGIKDPVKGDKTRRFVIEKHVVYAIRDRKTQSDIDRILDFTEDGKALKEAEEILAECEEKEGKYFTN